MRIIVLWKNIIRVLLIISTLLINYEISYSQSQDSLMIKFNELNNLLYNQKPVNYIDGLKILKENESFFMKTHLESFYYQIVANFHSRIGKNQEPKQQFKKSIKELVAINFYKIKFKKEDG